MSSVEVFTLEVRVRGVFRIALGAETRVETLYVKVTLDDGSVGWGEGAPAPRITGEYPRAALEAARIASQHLPGIRLPEELSDALELLSRLLPRSPAARAALESALLDAYSRSIGAPLCALLGGCRSEPLRTSFTISLDEPEVMASKAAEAVEKGFRRLKLKLGGPPSLDIARVEAVRKAVGDDAEIMVDANQAWSLAAANKVIPRLESLGVMLVEQPLPAWDLRGLAELSRRSPIPIAVDESVMDMHDLAELVGLGFRGVVNVKVSRVGGPLRAARILQASVDMGLEAMVGCMLETSLGISHAVHAVSTVKPSFVDLDAPLLLERDPAACKVYDGVMVAPPRGPGVGCEPRLSV